MYAVEFETDIRSPFIELKDYERLANRHAKVIILVEDEAVESATGGEAAKRFNQLKMKRNDLPPVDPAVNIDHLIDGINDDTI